MSVVVNMSAHAHEYMCICKQQMSSSIILYIYFGDRISPCFSGGPGTVYVAQGDLYLYVAQAGLELTVLLPQPSNSWEYRNMSHAVHFLFLLLRGGDFLCSPSCLGINNPGIVTDVIHVKVSLFQLDCTLRKLGAGDTA